MPAATFIVLHGEDEFSLDEELARLRAELDGGPNAGLNTSVVDGPQTTVSEVLGAVEAYPFLADSRVVIARGLLAHLTRKGAGETGKKGIELLVQSLPALPAWSRLIFAERGKLPDSNAVLKLAADAKSNGAARRFDPPEDSTGWILKRAELHNGKIERNAARALSAVTQGDLRLADNELYKLIAFAGQRVVTEADVAQLTPYVAEAVVFDMVDALAEGRGERAARLAHRLLNQNEDLFGLLAMITRQFRLLLLVRDYLDDGGRPDADSVSKAVGVHAYPAKKLLGQVRHFDYPQLVKIYTALYTMDVRIKTGEIQPELALDLLIARLAGT
ncbi:MAG: DNA polymerase III subunit delta [Anaerolineae bacterium]|nr:DNA polymerase III subunit delta [Anaerolineae bacterium]